jgi:uncharacterized delta-60 repeat protein
VIFGLEREPDGRILVAGLFSNYEGQTRNGFMRISSEGLLDRLFLQGLGPNGPILGIIPMSQNRTLLHGSFNNWNGNTASSLVAINSDGTINSSFTAGTIGSGVIFKAIQQPDGKILVAGSFTSIQGITRNRIARLNANGTIDATFNPGNGPNNVISDMVLLPDGKIVIVGSFLTVNSISRRYIARLNSNGTLDNAFNAGNSSNDDINCIQLLPDGKFLVGGFFTTFNLQARQYLARINANGTYDATFLGSKRLETGVRDHPFGGFFDMIFKPFTMWIERTITNKWFWITKPLYNCPPCMILLYGFPFAFFVYDGQPYGYFWMFAYCMALSGVNKILTSIIYRD